MTSPCEGAGLTESGQRRRSFLLLIAYFGMAATASWRRVRRSGSDHDAAGRTVDLLEYTVIVLYHIMLTVGGHHDFGTL